MLTFVTKYIKSEYGIYILFLYKCQANEPIVNRIIGEQKMNINWNTAASASLWANYQAQHKEKAETTGAVANNTNNDPIFKNRNVETTGAVAMFGEMNGAAQDSHFMAVA